MVEIALIDKNRNELARKEYDSLLKISAHGNGVRLEGAWPIQFTVREAEVDVWGYQWIVNDNLRSIPVPFNDGSISAKELPATIELTPYFDSPFEDMSL